MEQFSPDALVALMESLADPTRIRLLRLLERNELGVAELCQILQLPQSTVSRHLKVLLDEGWLGNRAQGTANLYRMSLGREEGVHRRLWTLTRDQTASWPTARQDRLRVEQLLARRRGPVEAFFKGAAGQWDRLRADYYGPRISEALVPAFLPSHWVVADLGCGTGQTTAALAPFVRRVVGVDQSQAMLTAAARRTTGASNVELRKGRLEALPIEDQECDAAILLFSLAYVPEPVQALSEAARILKKGGRFVLGDILRHDREDFRREMGQEHLGWDPIEMTQLLEEAGFDAVLCRPLPPEPGAKGPALLLASAERRESPQESEKTETREESR